MVACTICPADAVARVSRNAARNGLTNVLAKEANVFDHLRALDDRGELSDIGMTAQTLRPGDQVIVVGSPARREPNRLYLARLDRPADGYSFEQVGGRPRLRSPGRRP